MQYILSQEEFDQLKNESANAIKKVTADLQTACTLVADHMPIKHPWASASVIVGVSASMELPWGCIITRKSNDDWYWYCDHCPVRKICPHPNKNFSK